MLPVEFIPPTILIIVALVVWLLARLNRKLTTPAQTPEPEDFLSVWDDVLAMPEQQIQDRLAVLDATTDWSGPGRHRRGVRRVLPDPQPFLPDQRSSEEDWT